MTYEQAIEYISATLKFGSKPGLERIRALLKRMGDPQDSLGIVHVAGTNGKGSTSNAVAAALTQAGIKTGLYISPYVFDFCERIQIDGRYIRHEELAREVEHIRSFIDETGDPPTEFELITALAFGYFKRMSCEVVVLEVGLGGRFDATNVIAQPLISVVTSISYDHMEILGDTLEKIAFEKCGIIKEGCTVVTSPRQEDAALGVIRRTCEERHAPLIIPDIGAVRVLREGIDGTEIEYRGVGLHIPLAGRHQISNFITAFETVKALRVHGIHADDSVIVRGMAKVAFPARQQILRKAPLILLDGAHNAAGAATLADSIRRFLKEKPVLIMGMLADKEYEEAISMLAPLAKAFIAVRPQSPRALDPAVTAQTAARFCAVTFACEGYDDAVRLAQKQAQGGPIVICGSLYLAGAMNAAVDRNTGACPSE